jgi:hypothetical protein
MASDQLEQVDGAVAGAWIKPALEGDWGGAVKNLVPQIYEAYARIFHPALDEDGTEVTWAEVAQRLGEIVPVPWEPGDPPSWRVQISGVPIVVKHGPELLFEFPDED